MLASSGVPYLGLLPSPRDKGRTFHELDILFAKNVPARKFATTNIDAFDEADTDRLASRYQRGGSVTVAEEAGFRRPSIAVAVTEYAKHR